MAYTSKPFAVVCSFDEAVDEPVGPEMATYTSKRDEESRLALKYRWGERPSVYWCRRLTVSEEREVETSSANENEQYAAAFARGLVRVEGMRWADGTQRDWQRPDEKRPISEDALMEFFDRATRVEIGMVIWGKSFLARQSGLTYRLPHICALAVGANLSRRVARMIASVPSAESKPPAEAQPVAIATSSPAGDASTGAIATASAT